MFSDLAIWCVSCVCVRSWLASHVQPVFNRARVVDAEFRVRGKPAPRIRSGSRFRIRIEMPNHFASNSRDLCAGLFAEFLLGAGERIEQGAVTRQGELIGADVVVPHERDERLKQSLLLLRGRAVRGLPRPTPTVPHADLQARIEKPQLGTMWQRRLDQVAVATIDYPFGMGAEEGLQRANAVWQRKANSHVC